jgi:hypothetical protein
VSSDVVRGDVRFVGFSRIFLLGILTFKGLNVQCLYKSFGVKGLKLKVKFTLEHATKSQKRKGCIALLFL